MFLVPALLSLLMALFAPAILADTRPEYGYWGVMWIVAKLGLFVCVLRQLLRYGLASSFVTFPCAMLQPSHGLEST
jgi:hypothetical protein